MTGDEDDHAVAHQLAASAARLIVVAEVVADDQARRSAQGTPGVEIRDRHLGARSNVLAAPLTGPVIGLAMTMSAERATRARRSR